MSNLEAGDNIQTKYEIFTQLQQERSIACGSDVGYVMRKESWERIDTLLDYLIDVDALASLVEVEPVR